MTESPSTRSPFPLGDWHVHNEALARLALGILKDSAAAEDAVQEVWLRLCNDPPRVLSWAWMARVVRSRAFDEVRRRSRQAADEFEPLRDAGRSPSKSPDEIAARLDTYRKLAGAVEGLPEKSRQVIYLRYFEGLTPTEIAAELDLATSAVKKRLERALRSLRESFGDERSASGLAIVAFGSNARGAEAASFAGASIALKWALVGLLCVLASFAWLTSIGRPAPVRPSTGQAGFVVEGASAVADLEEVALASPETTRRARASDVGHPVEVVRRLAALELSVVWHDGSPAVGCLVSLQKIGPELDSGSIRSALEVGASGRLRFEGLSGGVWRAVSNYMSSIDITVEARQTVNAVLEHDLGFQVSGRVLDPSGLPVAGASVWLAQGVRRLHDGAVVATTDQDGRFEIQNVDPACSLGAFASAWAPSSLIKLRHLEPNAGRIAVNLALRPGGSSIRGRVVDPTGAGVAGAWVACGGAIGPFAGPGEGLTPGAWSPRATQTDARGDFELIGLRSGVLPLCATSRGFPVWNGSIDTPQGEVHGVVIELQAPAQLVGVVRDAQGLPVPFASVHVFDRPLDARVLSLGQLHYNHPIGHPQTRSDALGRYELKHLWPSQVWAYCFEPGMQAVNRTVKRSEAALTLSPEAATEWNPIIAEGQSIRGQLVYSDGQPIRNAYLFSIEEETGDEAWVRSDRDGHFAFYNLVGTYFTVGAELGSAPEGKSLVELKAVSPSEHEVRLIADFAPASVLRGSIRGRVDDVAGRVVGKIGFELEGPRSLGRVERRIEDRRFEYTNELPGRHRLVVLSGGRPVHITPWFDLKPGEALDLGVLSTEPGGAVRLTLDRTQSDVRHSGHVILTHLDHATAEKYAFTADDGELLLENLVVGPYSAAVAGGLDDPIRFDVAPSQVSLVRLRLAAD